MIKILSGYNYKIKPHYTLGDGKILPAAMPRQTTLPETLGGIQKCLNSNEL